MPTENYYNYAHNIQNGLTLGSDGFNLNHKNIILYSGLMHYYRIPEQYWRDRLQKMRKAGLNAVETNVPWNLHEPELGFWEFGYGSSAYDKILDVEKFLRTAQEEDLFAIVRIGSVVDYGLDSGGTPAWINRNNLNISFLAHLQRYIAMLFLILGHLQFNNKGPIIGFYITNDVMSEDFKKHIGLKEYVFKDNKLRGHSISPGNIPADQFDTYVMKIFEENSLSSDFHLEQRKIWSNPNLRSSKDDIIVDIAMVFKQLAYINIFAFTAGTTFGFLNGAVSGSNKMFPNSFDFESPISESGVCRNKYYLIRYTLTGRKTPTTTTKTNSNKPFPYGNSMDQLSLKVALNEQLLTSFNSKILIPMSEFPINRNSGQAYGLVVYRKLLLNLPANSKIMINISVDDLLIVMINGITKDVQKDNSISTGYKEISNATVDVIYENGGRSPQDNEPKGLSYNSITLNNNTIHNWFIFPLDFREGWSKNLSNFRKPIFQSKQPAFYKVLLDVHNQHDLFLDMTSWGKGVIVINGFILSRYDAKGFQRTVYLPGAFLNEDANEMIIFDLVEGDMMLQLISREVFDMKQHLTLNAACLRACDAVMILFAPILLYSCNCIFY